MLTTNHADMPAREALIAFLVTHMHYERDDLVDLPYECLMDGLDMDDISAYC